MFQDLHSYAKIDRQIGELDTRPFLDNTVSAFVNNPNSLLLLTIPKSGTTWLRYLLVNYSMQVRQPHTNRVDYEGLARFTAPRDFVRWGRERIPTFADDLRAGLGVDYVLYQHPHRGGRLFLDVQEHGGPKMCVYRNVLDFIVSIYYFIYNYRDSNREIASHPRELIEIYTRYWALCFRYFTEKAIPAGRATLVSYDELQIDTAGAFARALDEIGIDVVPSAVERAVGFSTAARAADDERERGQTLVADLDRGSFVRNGEVGQWRQHFERSDVDRVVRILRASGVTTGSILEPLL